MVSTPGRGGTKKGHDKKAMSPLSNRPDLWDSPPSDNSTDKKLTPSSQRKLFGGFRSLTENIENAKRGMSKKIFQRGSRSCTKEDAKPNAASVAMSDLFSESSPIGSRKKLLAPRISRRSHSSLLPEEKCNSHLRNPFSAPDDLAQLKSPPKKRNSKPPKLSPRRSPQTNDPPTSLPLSMSPLHPPCNNRANDPLAPFTMTPKILYNHGKGKYNNRSLTAPMSGSQHYHQSPHWSGQVRVNPFSPVPERYLQPHPPTSTKSVARGTQKQRPGFYELGIDLGPPTLPPPGKRETSSTNLSLLVPRKKKARFLDPIRLNRPPSLNDDQDLFNEISPTDVTQMDNIFDDGKSKPSASCGKKRKAQEAMLEPPPQSREADASWQSNKRMRIKRGRYLDDFQEVQFLGSGSFGSVNACLSRLDGCMYAVKSISPGGQIKTGNDGIDGHGGMEGAEFLYGGRKMMSNECAIPPTPRRDMIPSPLRRKKTKSRFGMDNDSEFGGDDWNNFGALEGSSHWNDGSLRRMLREVFALAALCQQDDVRTFHVVRYQQAWLEDDGTLYIQTELCSATLRDEMSGKFKDGALQTGPANDVALGKQTIDVFRQAKILREVLLALELVHQQGMVHLDIKPENIFIKNDLYKLGDFGLANAFTKNGVKPAATPDIEEGDSRYMAKDLLDFSPKDLTKCDIFSVGATMYEVCSQRPLPMCGQEWQDLRNGKLPSSSLLPGTVPCLAAIIREMMHPDPDKRPSATDLLSRDILAENSLFGNPGSRIMSSSSKVASSIKKMDPRKPSLKRSASWTL